MTKYLDFPTDIHEFRDYLSRDISKISALLHSLNELRNTYDVRISKEIDYQESYMSLIKEFANLLDDNERCRASLIVASRSLAIEGYLETYINDTLLK